MKLYDLLVSSANTTVQSQKLNGSLFAGHNGPYFDSETSVRNTAHWCITFLKAFKITNEEKYLKAGTKCGDYLLSSEARPMNKVFYCRTNPEKDFSNGLVGQAWAIEALVELYNVTNEAKYIETAIRVFLYHPFDTKYMAWKFLNVDGSYNGFDKTFNHQLWFAAAGALLKKHDEKIDEYVNLFLNQLNTHLELYSDGCVIHKGKFLIRSKSEKISYILSRIKSSKEDRDYMKMKSVGYHGFNLYAFAILKSIYPDHSFFKSEKMIKALKYAASDFFREELPKSKYGFPYNPPGFEIAYAFQVFKFEPEETISKWVSWQIKNCYNFDSNLMSEGDTKDPLTYAARFYEATRLKNYQLELD
ncbi:MAG: agl cluster protein AglQ [Candidatus Paceibacterota bacterium]